MKSGQDMPMVFTHPAFDEHERVVVVHDKASGLRAIIAVHSTAAGPACGGVRFWPYESEDEALTDALRLSRGMSYKTIMAGLPLGGGKAVILADRERSKSEAMLKAFGRAVDELRGSYIAAEDVGITPADVAVMRTATPHVAGLVRGRSASGDPSPFTARGVFLGLEAAVACRLHRDLKGVRVGVLGLGAVGMKLAAMLHQAGAELVVADVDAARVLHAVGAFAARASAPDRLSAEGIDVFAPCALGGAVSTEVIDRLQAKVVAGAANNQLATAECGSKLHERGILYAPDYVINAGGIINVAGEIEGRYDPETVQAGLERIPATLGEIFAASGTRNRPTSVIADEIAARRLAACHLKASAA